MPGLPPTLPSSSEAVAESPLRSPSLSATQAGDEAATDAVPADVDASPADAAAAPAAAEGEAAKPAEKQTPGPPVPKPLDPIDDSVPDAEDTDGLLAKPAHGCEARGVRKRLSSPLLFC